MAKTYEEEIVEPNDMASKLAKDVNVSSYPNCPAVKIYPHDPNNFRGPVGFAWRKHILECMMQEYRGKPIMMEEIENDGAGGKPQFISLIGDNLSFYNLCWELITMIADDFGRSGRFPAVMLNNLDVKKITKNNFQLVVSLLTGLANALRQSNLVNITGETAIMKHSITAFCDTGDDEQLILTWSGACVGLWHKDAYIDNSQITSGKKIVGFWEPGYRCNGGTFFTNLILSKHGPGIEKIRSNPEAMDFIRNLTVPSKSYARLMCKLTGWTDDGHVVKAPVKILGAAHITGGGLWNKFGEILPEGVGADLFSMPVPAECLLRAQQLSIDTEYALSDWKAYSTFHGGCGMLCVVDSDHDASTIINQANDYGVNALVVGQTIPSASSEIQIVSRFARGKKMSSNEPF